MRLLLDTNVILDIALGREPHFSDSAALFKKIDKESMLGFITATTITDIYYIAKKYLGHQRTLDFIGNLIEAIDIIGIDKKVIMVSLTSQFSDLEDAIQSVAADINNVDYIITRNPKDFIKSEIKVLTPNDFLELNL